jgi:transposase-like protein
MDNRGVQIFVLHDRWGQIPERLHRPLHSKHLNNLIEQNHRDVKQRIAVMLGFKGFRHAAITLAGIKPMHRIRAGRFGLRRLSVQRRTASAVWHAVLAA